MKNRTFYLAMVPLCHDHGAMVDINRPSFNPCTQDPRILNPRIQDPQS